MKKYRWVKWFNPLWGREEFVVGFADTKVQYITLYDGSISELKSKALPKRRLIDNLKVLMACPIGFKDDRIGERSSEIDFIVYDYNVKVEPDTLTSHPIYKF